MRALGGKCSPRHNNKAFKWRFVLDVRKLRNFHVLSEHCNIECPVDVFIRASLMCIDAIQTSCLYALFHRVYYIHIQRGLSCCSVQQYRAMRRPPDVERAALKVPRFVLLSQIHQFKMTESGTIGQFLFFQIWKKTIKTNFSQEESSLRILQKECYQ